MVRIKYCVYGCPTTNGMTRHRFPNPKSDSDRFYKWIEILGMEKLRSLTPEHVYQNKRICFAHFEKRYKSPGNPRLHRNALPFNVVSDNTDKSLKRTASNLEQEIPSKQAKIVDESNSSGAQNILVQNQQSQEQVTTYIGESPIDDEIKISETIRRLELLKKSRNCNPLSKRMSEELGDLLKKAVTLDLKKNYNEAIIYYQKGIELLCRSLKEESNEAKKLYLKNKIKEYLGRAEKIKELLKQNETYHEQIIIENNSTGHSYERIFKKFLDSDVVTIKIEDPYIRIFYQCQNLLMFCELVVKNCKNLKKIFLITTQSLNVPETIEQQKWMHELKQSLLTYKVILDITYSSTLHDRQISFSNGWIVKIGRGLDYFKKPLGRFCLGSYDYDLRQCNETTIDIFHQKNLKQSFG